MAFAWEGELVSARLSTQSSAKIVMRAFGIPFTLTSSGHELDIFTVVATMLLHRSSVDPLVVIDCL